MKSRGRLLVVSILSLAMFVIALAPPLQAQLTLSSGDILFTAFNSVVRMDPRVSVRREVLAIDASDGIQTQLRDLLLDPLTGDLYAIDAGSPAAPGPFAHEGRVLRIDPVSGTRSVVGGCVDGARPNVAECFEDPFGLGLLNGWTDAGRQLVVTNPVRFDLQFGDPINNNGEIWLLDPVTGIRTLISQGGLLWDPHLVAVDPSTDRIYVTEINQAGDGSGNGSAVTAIDPVTGRQEIITAGGLLQFQNPVGIAYDPQSGDLFVEATFLGLVRVDPDNPSIDGSNQTLVARSKGAISFPVGIALEPQGTILVADAAAFRGGGIFRLDPASGAPRVFFANSSPRSDVCCVNGFVRVVK